MPPIPCKLSAFLALVLAACSGHAPQQQPDPPIVIAPPVEGGPVFDEVAIDTAERVCQIDSLRAERDERIEQARELVIASHAPGSANARSQDRDGSLRVDAPPAGPQTERTELVRAFALDLDAAYRFAAGACQAHALCMHQRDYVEDDCDDTRAAWDRAQDRFMAVSASLADIRLRVAGRAGRTGAASAAAPAAACTGERCRRDCSGVIADIFTTGAC